MYKDKLLDQLRQVQEAATRLQVTQPSPEVDKLLKLTMDAFEMIAVDEPWRSVGQSQEEYMAAMADDDSDV